MAPSRLTETIQTNDGNSIFSVSPTSITINCWTSKGNGNSPQCLICEVQNSSVCFIAWCAIFHLYNLQSLHLRIHCSYLHVGISGSITRQGKGGEGMKQCKTQWDNLHNRNCTVILRVFNPVQCLGWGLFIPPTLLQHSKNASSVFPEVRRLQ